jgi:muconate cycloisomerase
MKIVSADIWTVVVPTIQGRVHSPEWVAETGWDQVPKHILRLNTDTELYGLGESGRGLPLEQVQEGVRLLLGRKPEAIRPQRVFSAVDAGGEEDDGLLGQGPAYDTCEMAVLDLIGKARGLPVHALLGGAVRSRVRADYWIGHQTPEAGKRSVERAMSLGFKGVKIKCKLDEPMVERLEAMRQVGGTAFKVTVDPNERFYTAEQALPLCLELEALGNVEVFEDPIPKGDYAGYTLLRQGLDTPVAQHLGAAGLVLKALKGDVADCFNLGGSLFGFVHAAAVAAAAGFKCWHGSGNDLGIVDTAHIHAAAAAPNCTMASDFVGSWTREDDLITEAIPFADGYTSTPTAPGLGCDLDQEALGRYVLSHERIEA